MSLSLVTSDVPSDAPIDQSASPVPLIGVNAAIHAAKDLSLVPRPRIFDEFSLKDRVGIVTGGNRGLGLEMALALCELGARAIYCFDLSSEPGQQWKDVQDYVRRMGTDSRLEYVSADVRDQKGMWDKVQAIGDKEGRIDVCVAAAGIAPKEWADCVSCPAHVYQEVMDINTGGVFFTAQAAAQQMLRFQNHGSIILIASIAGSVALRGTKTSPYNASKAAVVQLARSMACELGNKGIRVNTISPGFIRTPMIAGSLDSVPEILERWSDASPMGRIGRPDEVRGVVSWLASDASSFCTGSDIIVSGGYHSW